MAISEYPAMDNPPAFNAHMTSRGKDLGVHLQVFPEGSPEADRYTAGFFIPTTSIDRQENSADNAGEYTYYYCRWSRK